MSIHARGIVLSGEFGRLVVEASDAEVDQFGKGALVEVKAVNNRARAWDYAASRQSWPKGEVSDYSHGSDGKMGALLTTACGCRREIVVSDPPPHEIRLALHGQVSVTTFIDDPTLPAVRVRRFVLRDVRRESYGPHDDAFWSTPGAISYGRRHVCTAEYREDIQ